MYTFDSQPRHVIYITNKAATAYSPAFPHPPTPKIPATHLEFCDEWQEELSLQAVLIQSIRRPITGGHKYQPTLPQPTKQAVQDHGVRYIRHKQLI